MASMGVLFRTRSEAREQIRELAEARSVTSTEGARMFQYMGRRIRVPGTVIYDSNLNKTSTWETTGTGAFGISVGRSVDTAIITIAIAFGQAFSGTDGLGKVSDIITIAAGGRKIWTLANPSAGKKRYEQITIHKGADDQAVSSILEGVKGTGRVPAFRNTVLVVIKNFQLQDFGNRTPLDWEMIAKPDATPYFVRDAIADVWGRIPGRTSAELDVTLASGVNTSKSGDSSDVTADGQFEGGVFEGPTTPVAVLDVIEGAYDLFKFEREGVLHYEDRGDESMVHIPDIVDAAGVITGAADTGAIEEGQREEPGIRFQRSTLTTKVPSEVIINCLSKKMEYQADSTRFRVKADLVGEGVNIITLDLPLVLTQKAMRRVASRVAVNEHQRKAIGFVQLPGDYIDLEEGKDILSLVNKNDGQRYYLRVQQLTMGLNFLVEVEGVVLDIRTKTDDLLTSIPALFQGTDDGDDIDAEDDAEPGIGDPDEPDEGDIYYTQAMLTLIVSAPPVTLAAADAFTFLFAHCFADHTAEFDSSKVYKAGSQNGSYNKESDSGFAQEYASGTALTALPDLPAPALGGYIDRESTVDIHLNQVIVSIATITDEDLFGTTLNTWLIGDEVVQARDITSLSAINATITGTMAKTAGQLTRSDAGGDFDDDGFAIGQWVDIGGFVNGAIDPIENNRYERITALTATVMTLTKLQGDTMVDEGPVVGVTVKARQTGTSFRLSHLLRGMRDTRDHTAGHAIGEGVIHYDALLTMDVTASLSNLGATKWYKSVPELGTKNDAIVVATPALIDGESMRPFRPAHLHYLRGDQYGSGAGDPQNEVQLRWVHRTRRPDESPTSAALHPLHETKEKYDIEIYSDSGLTNRVGSYLRKWNASDHDDNNVRKFVYTNSQQNGDLGGYGLAFWVRIKQRGNTIVDGNWSDTLAVESESAKRPEGAGMAAEASVAGSA